jgi:NADP-dependent 3-hydroxy acid dehydrogenase YdfG
VTLHGATANALQNARFRAFGTSRRAVAKRSAGVTMLSCEVTDEASVVKLVDELLAETGRIDLLVKNAGAGLLASAEESSTTQAQALFDVNVFGVLRVTNAVLPAMLRRRNGRIINGNSTIGSIPASSDVRYVSTKHGIERNSESLDHELRAFGNRGAFAEPGLTRPSVEGNLTKQPFARYLRCCTCCHGGALAERCRIRRRSRGGGRDCCEGGNSRCGETTLRRRKTGPSGKNHAPFRPGIRSRQELAEAQPSASLMSTSIRSGIALCTVALAETGRKWASQ